MLAILLKEGMLGNKMAGISRALKPPKLLRSRTAGQQTQTILKFTFATLT